jgi:putative ABC transport system substrate-binding protein
MLTSEPCAPGRRGCAHDGPRGFSAILSMALALSLLTAPLAADAQLSAQVLRIGFLFPGPASLAYPRLEPFRQALRALGYIEGQNIAIETRWAEGKLDRLPELATELVRLKVNVIMTAATPAAKAAKHATTTIPIVMVDPGAPVSTGLVASLARPGGNATGLSSVTPDVAAKNLELLKVAVPQVCSVAFLWNAASPVAELALKEVQVAARVLAVQLQSVDVRGADAFESAFAAITQARADAVMVFPDPLTFTHQGQIVEFAVKSQLPAMFGAREFVEAGGLMSYVPNFPDLFRRAAIYVDKILKGAKPVDLPVEQPTKFELVINLKTAEALGLTIPPTLLFQATEVIQ